MSYMEKVACVIRSRQVRTVKIKKKKKKRQKYDDGPQRKGVGDDEVVGNMQPLGSGQTVSVA